MADRLGQRIGKYRLTRLLGKGGFAEVYLGTHMHLGTQAAVKLLLAQLASAGEVEQFRREAQTIAALVHPHIVRVLDFDVEDGTPYLVMDYAPNGSLRSRLPAGVPLAPDDVVPRLGQVADALQYAHEQKLVHRDIKPENMLVGRHNEVLLSDFGIATAAQSTSQQKTQGVAGTAAYMAPEQLQGKPRPSSDLYSLGVVVYEWLTGTRPFVGSFTEVASQHLFTPPPPLREKLPGISEAVEQVVLTALAKDPRERFGSVGAFATAFAQASGAGASLATFSTQMASPPSIVPAPAGLVSQSGATVTAGSQSPQVTPSLPPQTAGATPPGQMTTSVLYGPTHLPPPAPLETSSGSSSQEGAPGSATYLPPGWAVHSAPARMEQAVAAGLTVGEDTTLAVLPASPGAPRVTAETAYGGGWPPTERNEALLAAMPGSPVPGEPPSKPGISRRRVVVAGGVGLVLLGSGAAALLFSQKTGSTVHTSPGARRTPTPIATSPTPPPGTTLFTFRGHTAAVNSLAWSPDGARIASASDDLTVQVWDATTGANVLLYREHGNKVLTVAWSPDGAYLASAGVDATVRIWEAATGKTVSVYSGHQSAVAGVAWSPDSKRLASASYDNTAQVWEALSQQAVFTYRSHRDHVWSVAWSPDGGYVASASKDQTVRIWDPSTGTDLSVYTKHTFGVGKVAWSPGGNRIASGSFDGTVQIWDPSTGGNRQVLRPAGVPLTWSTYGQRIATADQAKSVQVWSVSSGTTLLTYRQHTAYVENTAWSPEGDRLASASDDHTVQVWVIAADGTGS